MARTPVKASKRTGIPASGPSAGQTAAASSVPSSATPTTEKKAVTASGSVAGGDVPPATVPNKPGGELPSGLHHSPSSLAAWSTLLSNPVFRILVPCKMEEGKSASGLQSQP